nr:hypothetical protein [Tanacetum cinerariifolium]
MSNPNVALISSPEEMSQPWFKASVEFIKGLDNQDGKFFQDDQGREKCTEQHNRMCGDTEDGTFVDGVVGKIYPKMNRMSVDDGDGVLDSWSDNGDGVLDSQTKDVIEEAAMLPTMSSNSLQARNATVSKFFAEFDALKKEVLLIKRRKDDEIATKKILMVNSYDDDYIFNDEEQPAKSSLNDLELQQEPNKVDVQDGILEQQPNADKGKTNVIQETVGVTVEEGPSLGRGLGTLKFKKKNCQRTLRPN